MHKKDTINKIVAYLPLLFSIAWVELKVNSSFCLCLLFIFFFFFFFQLTFQLLHPYYNSFVRLTVLLLEIIPKEIWNCNIVKPSAYLFSICLSENTSRMQYTQTHWSYALSSGKNVSPILIVWMVNKYEWITIICSKC